MTVKYNLKKKQKNGNSLLLKAKLILYLERGLTIDRAAKLSGLTKEELDCLRLDPEFEDIIENSEIRCEFNHLNNIKNAGDMGAWQASSWMLERLNPERYGKKDVIKHEFEFKLQAFQKIIIQIVNDLPPQIKHLFMQKLRSLDVDSKVIDLQQEEMLSSSLPVPVNNLASISYGDK